MFVRNELHRTAVLEGLRNGLTLVNLPGMTPKTCSNTSDPVNSSAIARPASMREKPSQIVLIVEDDRITREGLSAILTREGYQTVLAADGREGLECLRRGVTPGLILLDMMMPNTDGWGFLSAWRQTAAWASIPIVILTGMGIASPEWASALGARLLVRKPIDVDSLLRDLRGFERT